MGDRLPTSVSSAPGSGWLLWLVVTTFGLSSGASGSIWSAGSGLGIASGHDAGAASVSRMVDDPLDGSRLACTVEFILVPITAGRVFVSADFAVLTSFILSDSSVMFGGFGAGCSGS